MGGESPHDELIIYIWFLNWTIKHPSSGRSCTECLMMRSNVSNTHKYTIVASVAALLSAMMKAV